MRKLKRIGFILLAVLGILAIVLLVFLQSLKPDYSGEKGLDNLNLSAEVKVYYDSYGIPHIYGENNEDAFKALGYVHAQDRLWQMELLRRVAKGGLSEVFGKDLISTDRFFLSVGIDEATKKTLRDIDRNSEMVQLCEAYLEGVNQFIEEGPTPLEFYLTGLQKEPFSLEDIYNAVGYMGFSFAMAHKTDPLLTHIADSLGVNYLDDLGMSVGPQTEWIRNYAEEPTKTNVGGLMEGIKESLKKLPLPLFEGSNSWVIGAKKTREGAVILANDPHIGFAQPSVWFEAHVVTPSYEKYGYHLAGVPFPLLGHNRKLAYGLTMFENDDVDFYFEETHPADSTQYKTETGWKSYEYITKNIKVKGEADSVFTYKKTRHGPILNGIARQVEGFRPISMSWIYTQRENKIMHALHAISMAENLSQFKAALPNIHAPGLNVMYGDAKGNIAWWATAQLYLMPPGTNTKLIMEGAAGKQEPERDLTFSENPQAINPPWNYVYSANNQPDSIAGVLYPGYYLPENRAKRIVQLLESRNDWDRDAVASMITDVTSAVNPSIITDLAKLVDVKELSDAQLKILDNLGGWDGTYHLDATAPTVYHRWIYYVLKGCFEDELGEKHFSQLLATHLLKRLIAPMAKNDTSVWWDDVSTSEISETQNEIVNAAFLEAIDSLEDDLGTDPARWTWDKVHTLEHDHPIGQVASLRSFFNVGPFPIVGGREVINNLGFSYSSDPMLKVGSGPSTRRVIDFSDIENSISILPTGQSGNPLSPHYEDQAKMYVNGEFRKMLMNKDTIIETSKSLLILK